jgi:para-aminobenzoate synthetase
VLLPPFCRPERTTPPVFISSTLETGTLTVPDIYETLNLKDDEIIILDSEMRQVRSLGETSIIRLVEQTTRKVSYSTGMKYATWQQGDKKIHVQLDAFSGDFFAYLKELMEREAITNSGDRTFCGGLMGYITYEACLEGIGISAMSARSRPDICFAFVERSIVIDHRQKLVHIQSIEVEDTRGNQSWPSKMLRVLAELLSTKTSNDSHPMEQPNTNSDNIRCFQPLEACYKKKIRECQEHIRAGNCWYHRVWGLIAIKW